MTKNTVIAILLIAGVLVELLCAVGLLLMRNAFDRLHATAPANILPPLFFAAAIIVREGLSQSGIKAVLIALLLLLVSPIVSHATARAEWIREKQPGRGDA